VKEIIDPEGFVKVRLTRACSTCPSSQKTLSEFIEAVIKAECPQIKGVISDCETNDKRVSINFCGGCNPRINRGKVASEVKELLTSYGYLISFNSFDVNLVIYLSGCTSNCAQKYSMCDIPCVVIAAFLVDTLIVDESWIVAEIVKRVRNYYEELER